MFYSDVDRLHKKCIKCRHKDKIAGICRDTILFYTKIPDNQNVLKIFEVISKCFSINCVKYNRHQNINLAEILKNHDLYTFTPNKTE